MNPAIQLNQHQLTALIQLEMRQLDLMNTARMLEKLPALSKALNDASASIEDAKQAFLTELQNKVQLATPQDAQSVIKKLELAK